MNGDGKKKIGAASHQRALADAAGTIDDNK
jgi:hypothetical protein